MNDCETKYCRGEARPGRRKCPKCRSRQFAKRHPFAYHYNALKQNAKRRDIDFDLTIEEFRAIWSEHPDKWEQKKEWGVQCKWQMDRIDPRKGYTADNLQILEKRKNIQKWIEKGRFMMEVNWTEKPKSDLKDKAPF